MTDATNTRRACRDRGLHRLLAVICVIGACGCGTGDNRVDVPGFDPQADAAEAISAGDANQDGMLSAEELSRSPGLRAAMAAIDRDGNGGIDAVELAARLQSYVDDKIGLLSLSCEVSLDGAPLDGATVEFIPEQFLADVLQPARGKTRRDGAGPIKLADGSLPGIAPGIYRVKISKRAGDREMLPAHYNEQTELGFEVSNSDGGKPARFRLRSGKRPS